jgi:hypothetical protein
MICWALVSWWIWKAVRRYRFSDSPRVDTWSDVG